MNIIKVTNTDEFKNPHGVNATKLYDTKDAQVMHILLKPGESLKKHITPVDVFFYILDGCGIVEIGDEKENVTRDELIVSPANIPHCLHNSGDKIFRVLVVKTPKPTTKTIFV